MLKRGIWALLLFVAVAIYGLLEWTIDDWNRDLSSNSAATDFNANDPDLRPVTSAPTVDAAELAVMNAALSLKGWELVEAADDQTGRSIKLTCNNPYFGFVDDIMVTIALGEDGVVIHATSQSRSAWGDLGRNPRNLKQLLNQVRQNLWRE
jgi:uncharacterized protein (DUF1499 family)